MVQQTRCPDEGANYHRLIRRAGTTTVFGILTFSTTVAAQADGGGADNPLLDFLNAVGSEALPTLMALCFLVLVCSHLLAGAVGPNLAKRIKSVERAAIIGLVGAPLLVLLGPYLVDMIPVDVGNFNPFASGGGIIVVGVPL